MSHAFDPPHNQFPFSHQPNNLFSGHVLEADSALAHAMEEQLPALSRSFGVNHTLGWMIVIFLVVVGIVKIVEGLKIIESAKDKRHDKK
jgi:hypothetical protein